MSQVLLVFFLTTLFGSAEPPRQTALCISCHGSMGISQNPLWPNLAGQKKAYLIKQMKDFRSGKRQEPLMNGLAQTLNDKDIEALAEYYANLK